MQGKKILIGALAAAFLLAGSFGVGYAGILMGHGDTAMAGCPMMNQRAAVCSMDPLEHLDMWQAMFAAIPASGSILSLLLLCAVFVWLQLSKHLQIASFSPQPVRISFYSNVVSRDPLKRFTYRGLLHPKIF